MQISHGFRISLRIFRVAIVVKEESERISRCFPMIRAHALKDATTKRLRETVYKNEKVLTIAKRNLPEEKSSSPVPDK